MAHAPSPAPTSAIVIPGSSLSRLTSRRTSMSESVICSSVGPVSRGGVCARPTMPTTPARRHATTARRIDGSDLTLVARIYNRASHSLGERSSHAQSEWNRLADGRRGGDRTSYVGWAVATVRLALWARSGQAGQHQSWVASRGSKAVHDLAVGS